MKNLSFRPATEKDLSTLRQFEQGIIAAERPLDPTLKNEPFSYYDISAMIAADDVAVIIGTIDKEIVVSGYVRIKNASSVKQYEQYAYLGFIFVKPKYRGNGINQLLMDELLVWTKAQNVNEIRLDVYAENLPAIRAYEKAGFKKNCL